MLIKVTRDMVTPSSVSGILTVDGLSMYTLEPGANPINTGHPTIPAGKYRVLLTRSPHLGYVTPELQDVPGRTAIRIHVANFIHELLGCTAVGSTRSRMPSQTEWAVWGSLKAFQALMGKLEAATDEIWAEYVDAETAV